MATGKPKPVWPNGALEELLRLQAEFDEQLGQHKQAKVPEEPALAQLARYVFLKPGVQNRSGFRIL